MGTLWESFILTFCLKLDTLSISCQPGAAHCMQSWRSLRSRHDLPLTYGPSPGYRRAQDDTSERVSTTKLHHDSLLEQFGKTIRDRKQFWDRRNIPRITDHSGNLSFLHSAYNSIHWSISCQPGAAHCMRNRCSLRPLRGLSLTFGPSPGYRRAQDDTSERVSTTKLHHDSLLSPLKPKDGLNGPPSAIAAFRMTIR
jgi:hypothetical protein